MLVGMVLVCLQVANLCLVILYLTDKSVSMQFTATSLKISVANAVNRKHKCKCATNKLRLQGDLAYVLLLGLQSITILGGLYTMISFAITLYDHGSRRHVVSQWVVSNISIVRSVCSLYSESNNTNLLLCLLIVVL